MKPVIVRINLLILRAPPHLIPRPSVKAYGELPENAKINETDTFGEEEGECTFEFGEDGEIDVDDI